MTRPEPTFSIETITPAIAAEWLKANRSNRPLSKDIAAGYAEAMREGEWLLNGESIKFDWDGRLVDGQHRLAGVVKAGIRCEFCVIRGLDPEVFKTLDTGKKRSVGDVLSIKGVKNPNAVGIACRLLYRTLQNELGHKRRITNSQLDALRAAHARLLELCDEAFLSPYQTRLVGPGQLAFAFYMAVSVDEPKARAFFRAIAGRPEPRDRPQHQAVKLRERLESTMDEIVKPSTAVRLAWVIIAWNAAAAGKSVPHFSRVLTKLPEWTPAPRFRTGIEGGVALTCRMRVSNRRRRRSGDPREAAAAA